MQAKTAVALLALPVISVLAVEPVQALDLLSPGWSHPAPCDSAASPPLLYGCYEDLTATSITIYGQDSTTPPSSTSSSYTLPSLDQPLSITFDASFDPAGNPDSDAFYRVGASAPILFPGTGIGGSYALTLNPGEQLQFSINQQFDASAAGTLRISSFEAVSYTHLTLPTKA